MEREMNTPLQDSDLLESEDGFLKMQNYVMAMSGAEEYLIIMETSFG